LIPAEVLPQLRLVGGSGVFQATDHLRES
jgi:hypothetical protein